MSAFAPGSPARPPLIGIRCRDCGTAAYPPQDVCPSCMSDRLDPETLPESGVVYAFSTVHAAPRKWRTPYTIGYVDLPNGVRVFTHLQGADLKVGDTVRVGAGVVGTEADGSPRTQFIFEKAGAAS